MHLFYAYESIFIELASHMPMHRWVALRVTEFFPTRGWGAVGSANGPRFAETATNGRLDQPIAIVHKPTMFCWFAVRGTQTIIKHTKINQGHLRTKIEVTGSKQAQFWAANSIFRVPSWVLVAQSVGQTVSESYGEILRTWDSVGGMSELQIDGIGISGCKL